MKIAIIPARGGSKRIPRKNIRIFAGRPMIAHAIDAAITSNLFDKVIVSTDDNEISEIARTAGAEIPFIRPDKLANDITPTVPVIAHGIQFCRSIGWKVNHVCCIYPSVPLIQINDLHEAYQLLIRENAEYSFPVTEFSSAIQRALRRQPNGKMTSFFPEYELKRTQDLEMAYHDAGQFYWGTAEAWLTNPRIHNCGVGLPIPTWRVIDIDTQSDWEKAELLFKLLNTKV